MINFIAIFLLVQFNASPWWWLVFVAWFLLATIFRMADTNTK